MRWPWALLLAAALLLTPTVRADPAISSPTADQRLAVWTFSNPSNYTAVNATIGSSGASLSWTAATVADTTASDFGAALVASNVNLTASPGDVLIDNTSQQGPVQTLVWQPDPANLSDTFLNNGNGGKVNYGTAPDLPVGNWGGGAWDRALLQFPALPLPSNATLVGANLQLFMFDPITTGPMDFSAHRILDNWTEMGANWNTRDGVTAWNTTGGDFDATALGTAVVVGDSPGWFTWNITSLAAGWWTGSVVNDGLMVRQVADTTSILGQKDFYSSDTTNASYRPRLLLAYTQPRSHGHLESRIFDAGDRASWGPIWWNASLPAGTSVVLRTRSGNTTPVDGTWSAWSAAVPGPGAALASPPARYLQYSLDLFTPNTASPAVHDVAVACGRYAAAGQIDTQDFGPASLLGWGSLSLSKMLPSGTSVTVLYSQDGGDSWLRASAGGDLSAALGKPIRLRITLGTNDTTESPTVVSVALGYRVQGSALGGLVDWTILGILVLVAAGAIAAFLVVRRLRTAAFEPTGLFLMHEDGRLIARVGTEDLQDEIAASAMFTLVLRFVRDSFKGPEGTGGELKSLQVDEREVSIAKGRFLFLALVSRGPRPLNLPSRTRRFLAALEERYAPRLEKWDGLRKNTEGLERDLAWFLEKGYRGSRMGARVHYRP